MSRERIRQQVAIWNQMREQREQDLLERREWALWSQLPPSHNVEERPPPPPTLTELQVYSLADIYTSNEAYECPICLMSINTDDIIIPLRCGTTGPKHIFCLGCAREWLTERTGACPGCNTPVRLIKCVSPLSLSFI